MSGTIQDKFQLVIITTEFKQQAFQLLANTYAFSSPMNKAYAKKLGIPAIDIQSERKACQTNMDEVCTNGLCSGIIEIESGKLIAIGTMINYYKGHQSQQRQEHRGLEVDSWYAIQKELFEKAQSIKRDIFKPKQGLIVRGLGSSIDPAYQSMNLFRYIVQKTILDAKKANFRYFITSSYHRNLEKALERMKFTSIVTLNLKEWTANDGTQPYSELEEEHQWAKVYLLELQNFPAL